MKSSHNSILIAACLILSCMPGLLSAQLSRGGLPVSFSRSVPPDTNIISPADRPSMERLTQEDVLSPVPYRFAVNLPVDLGIGNTGLWTRTPGGNMIWRLNVKSMGALALILYFDRFKIPEGGKLFVYNPGRTQLLGAFTSQNNNDLSTFATGMIYGDRLTLEYDAPGDLPVPELHISEVGHAYRGVTDYGGVRNGFGGSGPCEVNINCSEGNSWQRQKRGVARINVKRGAGSLWCTGSLVNNVRNDGTPYFLTADHCGMLSSAADISKWIFYFNYEGTGCPDPPSEPYLHSLTGARLIAHGGNGGQSGSDFFLVKLTSAIPDSFNLYFNGWSLDAEHPSPSGVSIHHPEGDIKKISTYSSPVQAAHWMGNLPLAFWRVSWIQTANGHGTTEGGSSGSPLFDNQGRLIGTLTGGDSSCDTASLNLPDYYGMFSYHWDQNGTDSASILKCWLDPDNSGVKSVNGWALSVPETTATGLVTVFPNPVTDHLHVRNSASPGKSGCFTLCDIWGRLLLTGDWNSGPGNELTIDMSGFGAGVYLLTLTGGDRRIIKKVIRE